MADLCINFQFVHENTENEMNVRSLCQYISTKSFRLWRMKRKLRQLHSISWIFISIYTFSTIIVTASYLCVYAVSCCHDNVRKWKYFPRYWPFVRGIYRSPLNSPHKGQRCGVWMFPLICAWTNGWVNNRDAGDLRRYRAHYDVTVMVAASKKKH